MINYDILMGESRDEIIGRIEDVINDEKAGWELYEGLVVVPVCLSTGYFKYFQVVIREISDKPKGGILDNSLRVW